MTVDAGKEVSGTTVDFFELVAQHSGCRFEFLPVPRGRAWMMLQRGEADIVPDATYSPEREQGSIFIRIGESTPGLIALPDRPPGVTSVAALLASSLNVLVVRGFDYGPSYRALVAELQAQGRLVEAVAPENAVAMLHGGRADVLLAGVTTIVDAWEKRSPGRPPLQADVDGIAPLPFGAYLSATRLNRADAEAVQRAIQSVARQADARRLLARYYPPWALERLRLGSPPARH